MILGLTGGIAVGKSTVSRIFKRLGIEVLDADIVAKEISNRKDILEKLISEFGRGILNKDNELDRKKMRTIIFSKRENVLKINSIIHPEVAKVFEKKRNESKMKIVIFDIPLLFEAKLEYLCDKIVVVIADEETQIKRIIKRDKSDRELAKKIIDNQMQLSEKALLGDVVIDNNKELKNLKIEVKKIYEEICKDFRQGN